MVIYRPHRGGLEEAMGEVREFSGVEEMLAYIVQANTDPERGPAFGVEDLVLGGETRDDLRISWHDTRYVYTRRYHGEVYNPPAPIGFCAEDYGR